LLQDRQQRFWVYSASLLEERKRAGKQQDFDIMSVTHVCQKFVGHMVL